VRGCLADQYLDSMKLLAGSFAVPSIEIYSLQRIEVLHGPSSVVYGAGSPGGIINMISKRPTTTPYREAIMQAGNYDTSMAGFDVGGPVDPEGKLLYRLIGMGRQNGTQVDFTEYQRRVIAPSFTWRPNLETTWTVLGSVQNEPEAGMFNQLPARGTALFNPNGRISTSFFSGEPGLDKFRRDQAYATSLFVHRFNDVLTVRQNARWMNVNVDVATTFPTGIQGNLALLNRSLFTDVEDFTALNSDTQAEFKFNTGPVSHTLLLGNDIQRGVDTLINRQGPATPINPFNPVYGTSILAPPPIIASRRQTLNQVGYYVEDQVRLGNLFGLFGIRRDRASNHTDNLLTRTETGQSDGANSRRAGLLYLFDGGLAPYVQYTESFQPTLGTTFDGRPFKPTTGQQKEAGVKYQPPGTANILSTLAVFDLVQQNVLTPDPARLNFNVQTGAVRSKGIEFETKASVTDSLSVIGSYTYLNLYVEKSNDLSLYKRPVGIPTHSAAAWADYTFPWGPLAGFGMAAGFRYMGPSAGDNVNSFFIPGVTLVDAAVHYDFGKVNPSLNGLYAAVNAQNLFDTTYVQWCQNQGCYYGLRRSVIGTLRYRW
jgi:iron complex outermembrane recepter protein